MTANGRFESFVLWLLWTFGRPLLTIAAVQILVTSNCCWTSDLQLNSCCWGSFASGTKSCSRPRTASPVAIYEAYAADQPGQLLRIHQSAFSSGRTLYVRYRNTDRSALLGVAHSLHAEGSSVAKPRSSPVLLLSYRSPLHLALRKELNVSRIYWDFTRAPSRGPFVFGVFWMKMRTAVR